MEWTFVWGPPLVALLVAVFGGWLIAWLLPIPGTSFGMRWLVIVSIVLGVPIVGQLIRRWRE